MGNLEANRIALTKRFDKASAPRADRGGRGRPVGIARAWVLALAAAAATVVAPGGAIAQGFPLTLEEAIARVLASHPRVASSEADVQMAEEGRREAWSQLLPRIDLTEGYTLSDNPVFAFGSLLNQGNFKQQDFDLNRLNSPGRLENFQTRLTLYQPILSLPALAGTARAKATAQAASTAKDAVRERLALDTVESFYALALAEDSVRVTEEVGRSARANLDRARALVRGGAALESDALQAEVRMREVDESIITAKGNARVARLKLESLLGEPVGEIAAPVADVASEPDPSGEPLDALVTQAMDHRPDVLALVHARDAAERAMRAARAAFLPTLGFVASQEWDNANFASDGASSYLLGLSLGWNLFAGGGDRARAAQAKAGLDKAEAALEARRREVRLEVASAVTNLQSARARVEAAAGGVAQAAEANRILSRSYAEGLTPWSQLLAGEAALAQARLRDVQATHEARTAAARLRYATGRLAEGEIASRPTSALGRPPEGNRGESS